MMRLMTAAAVAITTVLAGSGSACAQGVDAAHTAKAHAAMEKAVAWLRAKQDKESGGWSVPSAPVANQPTAQLPAVHPAITALALNGLMKAPSAGMKDPAVEAGLKFLLSKQQENGAIFDRALPSYNTSIAVSTLSRADSARAREAVARAQEFLKKQQWSEVATKSDLADSPQPVGREHPYYGGVGYGRHGRPDLSNLGSLLQGLHDSGVSPDDECFKRALVFLQRVQMLDSANDMAYADGSKQGGFIYSVVPNAESVEGRAGQTYAGMIEESMDDGTKVSRLRCYGSMSYTGFKSYIYAGLSKDDERVKAAYGWAQRNYTVDENPGMKNEGLYYYLLAMTRALKAWSEGGPTTIETIKADGTTEVRNWGNEIIDRLVGLQNEDGSFKSVDKRWMEDNEVLITAYALIALGELAGK